MPNKQPIHGSQIGYTPSMEGIRGRVQGESESEYRRYVQLAQGDRARQLARARGLDTSGMAWDGTKFTDSNADHWYSDPRVLGPIAVGASAGIGALAGASGAGGAAAAAGPGGLYEAVPAGIASQGASAGIPLGGIAAGGGGGVGGAAGSAAAAGGGSALARIKNALMSGDGLTAAAAITAALAGGDGSNASTRASEEQARRMQAITEARMRRVDPLHEAATQLAFGRLPVSSRQGLTLPRVPLPG
jgi:hypothetical protein